MTTSATAIKLTLTRNINAPVEQVFDAWIDPEIRKQWWAAQPGMSCDMAEIDANVGGRYRLNMRGQKDGRPIENICAGEFIEIDRPHRLVFSWGWEKDEYSAPEIHVKHSTVTLTFREIPGGTALTLLHEGFPNIGARDSHEGGWTGCLESLAVNMQ
jgi:uncharacterized protein YndB with AHSA1/START domain